MKSESILKVYNNRVYYKIDPVSRFWQYVQKTESCWNWVGGKNKLGYGYFWTGDKKSTPHRFSYELHKGRVPLDLVIDHLCRNPSCVNPKHLEAVTIGENIGRSIKPRANTRSRTHCIYGHPFTGDNLYVDPQAHRHCITCRRQALREWRRLH